MRRRPWLKGAAGAALGGCARAPAGRAGRVIFKHQPLWGDPAPFRALLDAFRAAHPGIELVTEALPNASDAAHQFFLTALEGGASDFDVFVADVVWVAELAKAGWIADLTEAFPPREIARDYLAGPAATSVLGGRTYGVPWYTDVGVLYRRTDLVFEPPATTEELALRAKEIARGSHTLGYVWQARQYEGLVCNAYEAFWAHGAKEEDALSIATPEAERGLAYLRGLITSGASPRSVTSMAEEDARRVFQAGGAAFMRNWPYALAEAEREGSPVRGRVAVSLLPTMTGEPGHGALGGFSLVVNVYAPEANRKSAIDLVRHLTSVESALLLAEVYGRSPARIAPYESPELAAKAPGVAALREALELARPRPVTPFYPLFTDALQGELSAAVAGIRTPDRALARVQATVDRMSGRL